MAVAVATAPWSGHPWSPSMSATGLLGGGAATPVVAGAGFNWGSIVGSKVGGKVSSYYPNVRGSGVTSSFVRSYPYYAALRGLGQDVGSTSSLPDLSTVGTVDLSTLPSELSSIPIYSGSTISDSTSTATNTSSPNILSSILNAVVPSAAKIGQQVIAQSSPLTSAQAALLQAQAYRTATGAQTQLNLTSMLPMILIIGGILVLVMAMKK